MIRPKQIVSAAIKVTLFWSTVFFLLYITDFDKYLTGINLLVIVFAVAFGVAVKAYILKEDRRIIEDSIQSQTIRGMYSSIGAIPIHAPPLEASSELPSPDVQPPEIADFISQWRPKMSAPMQALLDQVLKTLWEHKTTPAAPLMKRDKGEWVPNGSHNHGGRSLITHSLLVANLMCEQAKYYKYEAPKHNGIALFKVLDPSYQLDPFDPLIPIIGLAHDIGKIECMVWEDGKPNKMDPGHDYKGARIVARMDPFWHPEIDSESRRILQTVLAHYHHVQDVPMEKNGMPTSDRLHALMELLVKCDRTASAMENCRKAEEKENVKNQVLLELREAGQMYEEVKPDANELMSVIHLVLLGAGRINNRTKGDPASIGWKYFLPQYQKTVVVLKEDVFIQAVADYMGMEISPEARTGGTNPVLHLTQEVLKTLNVANLLFNDFDEFDRSAMSQLYRADFYKPTDYFADKDLTVPKEDLTGVTKVFSMDSLICLQIDDYDPLQKLRTMLDYNCVFHMGKARLGHQGVKARDKRAREAEEASRQPLGALERIAAIQTAAASKEPSTIAPVRFRTLIERELAKTSDKCRIQSKTDDDTTIVYDCEEWLKSEANLSFELLQTQSDQWKKLAGIVRLRISDKGTKIIYLEKVVTT